MTALVRNGRVVTASESYEADLYVDGGRIVYGEMKTGTARADAKALLARGTVDLARLGARVERIARSNIFQPERP